MSADGKSYASVAASTPTATSTDKASAEKASAAEATLRPHMPRQRSRGQIARRNSITRSGSDARSSAAASKQRRMLQAERDPSITSSIDESSRSRLRTRQIDVETRRSRARGIGSSGEKPWLGGLYFTDIVFIAFTYSINLLRTLGLAEIADVIYKGLAYALTRLPIDLYLRWSLSVPPKQPNTRAHIRKRNAAKIRKRKRKRQARKLAASLASGTGSSSDSDALENHSIQPAVFGGSSFEDQPEQNVVDQLSPFHHLVILLSRFACGNFPHLLPRVLFAEETIGPFVYWRTGGGSNAMVQEFTDLNERRTPLLARNNKETAYATKHRPASTSAPSLAQDDGSFRAYLLSKDARLPIDVQRSNIASRQATTLLYLHGGGFSLGSVAFYAEALLRLRAKIALLESQGPANIDHYVAEARCVAVEYDLSPSVRFPSPLLQCLRCYAHLIEVEHIDPDSICLAGDSAGGNLAMAMLLCLDGQMRDEPELKERDWGALPMPGKAVLISPWVDLRPSKAHAFANLRKREHVKQDCITTQEAQASSIGNKTAEKWTNAVSEFNWDFVASESLLHFAQVYAGVLPMPRRVHGPLGWIAHVCGILGTGSEEDDETSNDETADLSKQARQRTKGFMNPFRAFSALSRPTRQLAKVTHDALTDPLLPRLLGLRLDDAETEAQESQSGIIARSESVTAGFQPLFTRAERRTDVVANTSQLYEPIEGPLSCSGADKIGIDREAMHARLRARHTLDTHPLISPAIGDWSRIKLKHGCLVTWGERERMADDIEAWVDSVVNNCSHSSDAQPSTDVPPAPDGQGDVGHNELPKTTGPHGEDKDFDAENEWMYTAVEKGPGGVHAWPYVSMYLAGTERERERGLDLLARFVARVRVSDEDVVFEDDEIAGSPKPRSEDVEVGAAQAPPLTADNLAGFADPPHAAPSSHDDDSGESVGSMPSDVDLHGLVDGPGHRIASVNIADAVRRAQELGFVETEATGADEEDDDQQQGSQATLSHRASQRVPEQPHTATTSSVRFAHTSKPAPSIMRPTFVQASPVRSAAGSPSRRNEPERGRSRSPRQTIASALSTTAQKTSVTSSSSDASTHFVSGVALHMPQNVSHFMRPMQQQTAVQPQPAQQQAVQRPQNTAALWWTGSGSNVGVAEQMSTPSTTQTQNAQDSKGENGFDAPLSISTAPLAMQSSGAQSQQDGTAPSADVNESTQDHQDDDQSESQGEESDASPIDNREALPLRYNNLEDIQEVSSEEALSPTRSISPPDVQRVLGDDDDDDDEEREHLASIANANIDPGYYGLSRWAIQRPEPEGLSDIAEEGSVLSASITSAAGGEYDRSRSLSPLGGAWRTAAGSGGNGNEGATPSLTEAAMQIVQGRSSGGSTHSSAQQSPQQRQRHGISHDDQSQAPDTPKQWRFLRDEIGMRRRMADEEEEDEEEDEEYKDENAGGFAFSPPAKPQPGKSLRVIQQQPAPNSRRASGSSLKVNQNDQLDESGEDFEEDDEGMQDSATTNTGAIGIQRKKPKGDVWW